MQDSGIGQARRAGARATAAWLLAFVVSAAPAALAQDRPGQWDSDFDDEKRPWKEIQAAIPPYPRAENLLPFVAQVAAGERPVLRVWSTDYDTPDGTGCATTST